MPAMGPGVALSAKPGGSTAVRKQNGPKYRRRTIYGSLRVNIGRVMRFQVPIKPPGLFIR